MKSTSTAVVVCLMLSAGQAALAGTNDILIGLDEKITYGPDGNSTRSRHCRKWVRPERARGAVWRSWPMLSAGCLHRWLIAAG
jgi:hypothetical protein